jgi:D-alanine-D-alanine ligase-like ATP-grasp enzyme
MKNINTSFYRQYQSDKLLKKEFDKRGYTYEEFTLGDKPLIAFTSSQGRTWVTRPTRLTYPLNDPFVRDLARNKTFAGLFAKHLNIPTAFTRTVSANEEVADEEIARMLTTYGKLVVKPEQASLSHGVTLNLQSIQRVREAIILARQFNGLSDTILIQEQVVGDEIRLVALEGKIIAALMRQTPRLVGDGASSIKELIAEENEERRSMTGTLVPYPILDETLIDQALIHSNEIPAKNEIVHIGDSPMIRYGGSVYNVLDNVHDTYIEVAERYCRKLGSGFMAIDIFLQDYSEPMTDNNMHFNEVNNAPVLSLFYSCRNGKNYDLIPQLVDGIEKRMHIS